MVTFNYIPTCFNSQTPKRSPKRSFIDLPGEVRNMIYTYHFQTSVRCEIWARPPATRKSSKPKISIVDPQRELTVTRGTLAEEVHEDDLTIHVPRKLGKYKLTHSEATHWPSSASGLPFVCRLVYRETLRLLYANTGFVFDAPKRLTAFLKVASQPNLHYVTKLELHYTTYGDPQKFEDRVWQASHLESWTRVCGNAARAFCGLRVLKLWVHVNFRPLQLSLREDWVRPLLQFRYLNHPSSKLLKVMDSIPSPTSTRKETLQAVEVHLKTYLTSCTFHDNPALAKANAALTRAFAYAISQIILGRSERSAMRKFNSAWDGKHKMWQHHLQYAEPTWGRITDPPAGSG